MPINPGDSAFSSPDFYPDATGQNLIPTGGMSTLSRGLALANLTTGALNVTNAYVPGYRFRVLGIAVAVGTPGTGSGATQAISMQISGVAVTGGAVTVTLANTATFGSVIVGSAATANNIGSATDSLSIVTAAGGTAFTAGGADIYVQIQNLDA